MDVFFDHEGLDPILPQENEKKKTYNSGNLIPSHLASPIVNDECEFMLNDDFKAYCFRHKRIKAEIKDKNITKHIYECCKDPYLCITNWVDSLFKVEESVERKLINDYQDSCTMGIKSWAIHYAHYLSPVQDSGVNLDKFIEDNGNNMDSFFKEFNPMIKREILRMKKVEIIKDLMCKYKIKFGEFAECFGLRLDGDLMFFPCKEHGLCIGPTTLLLCQLDNLQAKPSILTISALTDYFEVYPFKTLGRTRELMARLEWLRFRMGNDFYSILSLWEPLVIGFIVSDEENDLGFKQLYNSTVESMKEKLDPYGLTFDDVKFLMPKDFSKDEVKFSLELTGLTKTMGHPKLGIEGSFEKIRERGTKEAKLNFNTIGKCKGICIRDLIINYRKKHDRLPKFTYCPDEIYRVINSGKRVPDELYKNYALWSSIIFDKTLEYDYSPNLSELLKDSAAALPLEFWSRDYDRCAFHYHYGKGPPNIGKVKTPDKRIMSIYLKSHPNDLKNLIEERDKGVMRMSDCSCNICRKEQEIKLEGRGFVKQTYLQRLLQTSMEKNIAEKIFKYVPEQTMTDGELSLLTRMSDITRTQDDNLIVLNLDLQSWNILFRHALVSPFGEVIDQLFGFESLYKNNHLWFHNAYIFTNSRFHPPDYSGNTPQEGPFLIKNHRGGMEGMRQKLWTLITMTAIKSTAEQLGVEFSLMCQGDNQVVLLKLTKEQTKTSVELRERFLDNLNRNFADMGLSLKLEETWYSKTLFEYGKVRYYKGEAIRNVYKKGYRNIPDINDGLSTILSGHSTINTITESIAKGDFTPNISYILNQISHANFMHRNEYFDPRFSFNQKLSLLFYPSEFGGIPLSTYLSHTVRGYDDKLVYWVSIMLFLEKYCLPLYSLLNSILKLNPNVDIPYDRLIEDIKTLRISSLPSSDAEFKNITEEYLRSDDVTNPDIKQLYDSGVSIPKDELISSILLMEPMYLSLAHELLRNSNYGQLVELRNKFTNITTLTKIAENVIEQDFVYRSREMDTKLVKRIRNFPRQKGYNYFSEYSYNLICPTAIVKKMREDHWKLEFVGDTKPFPLHQLKLKKRDNASQHEEDNGIIFETSKEYTDICRSYILRNGPFPPYIGASTTEKIVKPKIDIQTRTPQSKSLLSLEIIKSYLERMGSNNFIGLVDALIKEKVESMPEGVLEEFFEVIAPKSYGGNMIHRFKSIIEARGAMSNFLITAASHIRVSTNNLKSVIKGGEDYTIFFQLIFLVFSSIIILAKEEFGYNSQQYIAYFDCSFCTEKITDVKIDLIREPTYTGKHRLEMPQTQVAFSIAHNYSDFVLVRALSIMFASKIADISQCEFRINHAKDGSADKKQLHKKSANISLFDFKHVDLELFLLYLPLMYKGLLSFILYQLKVPNGFFHFPSLNYLAKLMLDSGRFQELTNLTCFVKSDRHKALISPEYLSNSLVKAIICLYSKVTYRDLLRRVFPVSCEFESYTTTETIIDSLIKILFIKLSGDGSKEEIQKERRKLNDLNIIKRTPSLVIRKQRLQTFADSVLNEDIIDRAIIKEENIISTLRSRALNPDYYEAINSTLTTIGYSYNQDVDEDENGQPSYIEEFTNRIEWLKLHEEYRRLYDEYESAWTTDLSLHEDPELIEIKYIHHIFRPMGSISTSCNKVWEILLNIGPINFQPRNIYTLAEGSGSIAWLLCLMFPESKLFYNTLIDSDVDPRYSPDQVYPPSVYQERRINKRRVRLDSKLSIGTTDITKEEFVKKFSISIKRWGCDVFTMDAESKIDNDNSVFFTTYFPLVIANNCKLVIFKAFFSLGIIEKWEEFDKIAKVVGYSSFITKPISSHLNNKEIYIVSVKNSIRVSELPLVNSGLLNLLISKNLVTKKGLSYLTSFSIRYNKTIFPKFDHTNEDFCPDPFKLNNLTCGITCTKTKERLIKSIVDMSLVDLKTENYMFPIIRAGGIHESLENYVTWLVLSTIYTTSKYPRMSLFNFITNYCYNQSFSYNVLTENPFLLTNTKSETLNEKWNGTKTLIRRISFEKPCRHYNTGYISYRILYKDRELAEIDAKKYITAKRLVISINRFVSHYNKTCATNF